MEQFFMCWVEGNSEPRYKHETKPAAMVEAERLARLTGKPVYLLDATAVCTTSPSPIEWHSLQKQVINDWR